MPTIAESAEPATSHFANRSLDCSSRNTENATKKSGTKERRNASFRNPHETFSAKKSAKDEKKRNDTRSIVSVRAGMKSFFWKSERVIQKPKSPIARRREI